MLPVLSALLPDWRVLPPWTAVAPPAMASIQTAARPATSPAPLPETAPSVAAPSPGFEPLAVGENWQPRREWLVIGWAAGFALLMLRLLAGYWLLSRTARRCTVAGRLVEAAEMASRQLQIRQPVQVLLDSRRSIPMVWGLFRPRVLLPAEAMEWSESRLRSVLLHELAHIQRRDLAAQWLMQAACALHWFNPLVWFAAWRLHVEGERACDNLVLTSGVRPSDYAADVLHVATTLTPATGSRAVGLAMARPSRLEGRLLAVLNEQLNRRGVTRALMFATLLIGLCVMIPVAMLRAADGKQTAKPAADTPAGMPIAAPPTALDTVTVEIANDGSIKMEGKTVTLDGLTNAVMTLQQSNPNLKAVIRCSADVPYTEVVKALNALQLARVASISLAALDPDRRRSQTDQDQALQQRNVNREAEARRAEAASQAEVARARLRQAEAEQKRLISLHSQNLVSAPELDQARLNVDRLKAETLVDPPQKVRAELDVARAELAFARTRLNRMSELAALKVISQTEHDQAAAQVAIKEAQLRLAEVRLEQSAKQDSRESLNRVKQEKLLQILADEIQVAESQAKLAHDQRQAGTGSLETCLRADLDVLALKRERASLEGNTTQIRELIAQQLRMLQELERTTRDQIRTGAASEADALKVRRQILQLERQQAELE